ncbi:MAG: hypothetical protein CBB70_14265 [Planctomycetaceae bacterium TMED10]|nr:MAG: hypothetical protein CBB70_14265 [Planctomycetaceae bacterium TMED10]
MAIHGNLSSAPHGPAWIERNVSPELVRLFRVAVASSDGNLKRDSTLFTEAFDYEAVDFVVHFNVCTHYTD